eukprot:2813143-Rhodomonas_salina.2
MTRNPSNEASPVGPVFTRLFSMIGVAVWQTVQCGENSVSAGFDENTMLVWSARNSRHGHSHGAQSAADTVIGSTMTFPNLSEAWMLGCMGSGRPAYATGSCGVTILSLAMPWLPMINGGHANSTVAPE